MTLTEQEGRVRGELLELGAATVYEAAGGQGAMDPAIAAVWKGCRLCGPALPVECHPGDNRAIHLALERCQGGEVLVVSARGHLAGYWGEVLTVAAQARAVRGLVIDGGVRDGDALERRGFPVFARGLAMLRTTKHEPGRVGEPVEVGGVSVAPGDLVLGDADGVVVVPAARLDAVLEAARVRVAREREIMQGLEAGGLTLDLLGLRTR